ncbi:hypothetical protein [Streptomyces coeruleorubidus]|uniref:hypothetical protein n=1 Tax=Streptomyces coeruleorubidus TaxID=116188 RepID=UPI0033F4AA2E
MSAAPPASGDRFEQEQAAARLVVLVRVAGDEPAVRVGIGDLQSGTAVRGVEQVDFTGVPSPTWAITFVSISLTQS